METFRNLPFSEEVRQFFAGNQTMFHIMIQDIKARVFVSLKCNKDNINLIIISSE